MENIILYEEDTKKLKRNYIVLTTLFYVGLMCGVTAIIIYRVIAPSNLLSHYQPNGEDIVITFLCALFAFTFNLIIVKSNNFNQIVTITKNEIKIVIKKKSVMFKTNDLEKYSIIRNYFFHREYRLYFANNKEIIILSGKSRHVSDVFDKLMKRISK